MAIFAAAPNEVAYTDGELHPVSRDNADRDALVGDGSFSEMVGKMRQEFDELSVPQVEEILDWQKSQGWLIIERTGTDSVFGTGSAAEEVVEIIKNRDLYWRNFFTGVFHILHSSAQDSKRVSQVLRTLEIVAFAIGFNDVADAQTSAELAHRYGKSRETINKSLHKFLQELCLPPLPTQRTAASVENIRAGRNRNKKVKQHE